MNLPSRAQLQVCGPMVLRVPEGWYVSWSNTLIASPVAAVGHSPDFSVWIDSGTSLMFNSVSELAAFITTHEGRHRPGSVDARRVSLRAGHAILVRRTSAARFYEQYWLLHDGSAYRFNCQGTLAYLRAHKRVVSKLANAVEFQTDQSTRAYEAVYITSSTTRLGGDPTQPQATIELDDISLSEHLPWYAHLTVRVHGAHRLTIHRAALLISDSSSDPTAAPSLVQQGLTGLRKPFELTVGVNGEWDGEVLSGGQPLPGGYGSLEIDYALDGHAGTHIFPSLARPSGFP